MKTFSITLLMALLTVCCNSQSQDNPMSSKAYQIGDKAEDFELINIDGNLLSLASYKEAKGFIVVFTSNECPFAIAYEDRLIALHNEMAPRGYPVVAINSNDGSEGNGNTFQDMVQRHSDKKFPFVYLKDAKQEVYPKFGATKTPHVFILDSKLVVRYIGAIDDNSRAPQKVKNRYVAQAIEALENGKSPDPSTTKAIGCPIASKNEKGGKRPPRKKRPSADELIKMMDTNGDGALSESEVEGPLSRDFEKVDANNDGTLSKDELSKFKRPKPKF